MNHIIIKGKRIIQVAILVAFFSYPVFGVCPENLEFELKNVISLGAEVGLSFCDCRDATIENRKKLVVVQAAAILGLCDINEKLVVVSFAEAYLLQTFLLVNCLIWHGFSKLEVYVIGPKSHIYVEDFVSLLIEFYPRVEFSLKSYKWAQDYIADVNNGQASKGHSFDLVDAGFVIATDKPHNPYVDFAELLTLASEPNAVIFELGCASGRKIRRYEDAKAYKKHHPEFFLK